MTLPAAAVCAILLGGAQAARAASPPYPPSSLITGISWASTSSITYYSDILQNIGDNWPQTWADDDNLYAAYGDGHGVDHMVPAKLSLGFVKIAGYPATGITGASIRSATGEQMGSGSSGKKASGMLMLDGTLYMWVRNADNNGHQCQLAWSGDHAATWTWSGWKFAELGYCAFLNFGKNYAGARDGYVYMYSPDTPSAYYETDRVVLTRVPKTQITNRSAYEFAGGLDANGNPVWTTDITLRKPVFNFPGGCNRMDVTYNAPLGRYLMTMRSRAQAGGLNQFSIYEAPQPWGPWFTVFYTQSWDVDPGESQHFPSKWMSADGKTLYMLFSGGGLAVRKATLLRKTPPR